MYLDLWIAHFEKFSDQRVTAPVWNIYPKNQSEYNIETGWVKCEY